MPVTVAVVREIAPNERRVALTPEQVKKLKPLGASVVMQAGAGDPSHLPDDSYGEAQRVSDAREALGQGDIVFKVQPPTLKEVSAMKEGSILVSLLQPHQKLDLVKALRDRKITAFAMELLPRTTRAQAMDVLSSQAGMAGYKAVLIAAHESPKFFPMLTTAAGTVRPAKVLVIGAGVAGLQAIATARRLGAQVEGFDVRPEVKEQIESLGAKFLDLGVSAAGTGGYARELTPEERAEQQRRLAEHIKNIDVIISTAAVPGRPAPKIISKAMVDGMKPGAVIVDLAAETGGNCELTKPGQTFDTDHAVTIVGPLNVPSSGAQHASEMYARNLFNFAALFVKNGAITLDWEDELIAKSCITHAGEIKHEPTRKLIDGG
jgi:NAD(P) transhydrogenase subunit alpha